MVGRWKRSGTAGANRWRRSGMVGADWRLGTTGGSSQRRHHSTPVRAILTERGMNISPLCTCDVSKLDWAIIFPIAVWVLWLNGNNIVFGKSSTPKDLKAENLAKATEMEYLGIAEKHRKSRIRIQVKWLPPPLNWLKLNSNGSFIGNPRLAGGGGLIRNEN
ncbi:hypothetical protein SO802_025267 [Lithocarpus litseifolius]|uniref:Uncharacterized protein n=1 Tax=Lithocarpus litseifolius TaxID=425828 RepID=A0AAW2BWP1_9ROSI